MSVEEISVRLLIKIQSLLRTFVPCITTLQKTHLYQTHLSHFVCQVKINEKSFLVKSCVICLQEKTTNLATKILRKIFFNRLFFYVYIENPNPKKPQKAPHQRPQTPSTENPKPRNPTIKLQPPKHYK